MIEPRGLEDDVSVPLDAQPLKVANDAIDMLGAAAGAINVFDPKTKHTAIQACHRHCQQRRPPMPYMEPTGWAGRDARHHMLWRKRWSHTRP